MLQQKMLNVISDVNKTVCESGDMLKALKKFRGELLALYSKIQALTANASGNQTALDTINNTVNKMEEYSKKSSEKVGFTYVKLAELATLKQ